MPLRQANTELSEKSGMLQVEKKLLEEEIKRWKARTQVCAEAKSTNVLSRNSHGYICFFMTLGGKGPQSTSVLQLLQR